MQARLSQSSLYQQCPRVLEHLSGLGEVPAEVALPSSLLHLVKLRASQLNQCGFCQHMHANEARQDGEQQGRLDVLPAWREVDVFSPEERAALAWTEALTRISDQTISDHLYQQAHNAFGDSGLIELTSVILQINSWNRISVAFRFQPDIAQ
ncbi:carboxymuconolactone decarboxylase family protein [Aestuariibacter halophilus]|uniref:Carboxymuconolactone decarboxylase family protein n=1 Tax=Fluctibacter halophilus TaxID=226011 RepID=A0ABS8G8T3_9ALTE|nr:carboxymuconolactone decarboxylase family protein [Aestuariibacter halophilus]MCC2616230.1 carboxymuconolactone decarboxylase family protein [Aestuariibacter halophilus]